MNMKYFYYIKNDPNKEPIGCVFFLTRLNAAIHFANKKQLELKDFLNIFQVSK